MWGRETVRSVCPPSCAVCRSLIARSSIYDRPLGFFDYQQLIHESAVDVARNIDDDGHWLIDSSITAGHDGCLSPHRITSGGLHRRIGAPQRYTRGFLSILLLAKTDENSRTTINISLGIVL